MSHAEDLHRPTQHPAAGATDRVVAFVSTLRHESLSDEVRHYARRHLMDTVGVCGMMVVVTWAFGWDIAALFAIFFFTAFTDRFF